MTVPFAIQINGPASVLSYGIALQQIRPKSRLILAENDNHVRCNSASNQDGVRNAVRLRITTQQGRAVQQLAADMQAAFWRGDMVSYHQFFLQQNLMKQAIAVLPLPL
jgi:hypothetical protein